MINTFVTKMKNLVADKEGATAIEYGLIAAGISVAIVAVVFLLGDDLVILFQDIRTKLGGP